MELSSLTSAETLKAANAEKHGVALSSVLAAIGLTGVKLVVGIATGSLGVLSEAAHSALDLVAAAVTLIAVRISGKPADSLHMYGHGKVENLSALFETLLLLATCVWIIYEAIQRLFYKEVEVELSIWAFLVVLLAIGVDFTRSRALKRVADKYNSQALEADALHFSTDIWSSLVVFVGLLCVLASQVFNLPWLAKADAVAALGVSAIVIYVSFELGTRTINALIDGVPASLRSQVIEAAQVDGVTSVKRVRLRTGGSDVFIDISVGIRREIALMRANDIALAVEQSVRKAVPNGDVVVHIEPEGADSENTVTRVQVLAGQHGLSAHGIRIYELGTKREMELHLEVPETETLAQAHEKATVFEQALKELIPDVQTIVTHIEPTGDLATIRTATRAKQNTVIALVNDLPQKLGTECAPHDIHVRQIGDELSVSFHCTFHPDMPLSEVHAFTEAAEHELRSELPVIGRVIVHTEPSQPPSDEPSIMKE